MKTLGIVAHSAEGGTLCFITACREGQKLLGPHMHPEIVVSAIPMASSMPGWESGQHETIARNLSRGVEQVARAGADFFVCPDNTAHIVLERIVDQIAICGMHIADVVCDELQERGWKKPGLLGTKWTMTGTVYAEALRRRGYDRLVPDERKREEINVAIFDELCQGVFRPSTTDLFVRAIGVLRAAGADCVILGCTEIPLIITEENSPLPILDSTRLLAKHAVREAMDERPLPPGGYWITRSAGRRPQPIPAAGAARGAHSA